MKFIFLFTEYTQEGKVRAKGKKLRNPGQKAHKTFQIFAAVAVSLSTLPDVPKPTFLIWQTSY